MEGNEESKEGFVKRVLKKLNPFSRMPGPSDEFEEGVARTTQEKPPVTQGPTTLTPEPQR